jgi:hypothetical protein
MSHQATKCWTFSGHHRLQRLNYSCCRGYGITVANMAFSPIPRWCPESPARYIVSKGQKTGKLSGVRILRVGVPHIQAVTSSTCILRGRQGRPWLRSTLCCREHELETKGLGDSGYYLEIAGPLRRFKVFISRKRPSFNWTSHLTTSIHTYASI